MLTMVKDFLREEDGLGTVEIVVIIAVLVAVALIFRSALIDFVKGMLGDIFGDTQQDSVVKTINDNKVNVSTPQK